MTTLRGSLVQERVDGGSSGEVEGGRGDFEGYSLERSLPEVACRLVGDTEIWCQILMNNPAERIMCVILRRPGIVGAFPDDRSTLMLVAV